MTQAPDLPHILITVVPEVQAVRGYDLILCIVAVDSCRRAGVQGLNQLPLAPPPNPIAATQSHSQPPFTHGSQGSLAPPGACTGYRSR